MARFVGRSNLMETGKWITIIGCGPGSSDYVTPVAREACAAVDVAVGSERALALFPEFGGERIGISENVTAALDIVGKIDGTKKVAILTTGDPGLFSLAASFIRRFGRNTCHIVPGISSVQVAFSRVGLEWADAEILSAHHKKPEVEINNLKEKDKIALLAGRQESFGWIADIYDRLPGEYVVYVCEDMTLETEKVLRVDTPTLRSGMFSSRTVVLIIRSDLLK